MPSFETCLEILDQPGDDRPAHQEARAFLASIGYLPAGPEDVPDAGTALNRRRLLGLAARLDRMFDLPLFRSPGVHFFGGQADPATFGPAGFDGIPINVAGRGLTRRQAFESCVGEAAEHLSFLEWPADAQRWDSGGAAMHRACPDVDWCLAGIGLADRPAAEAVGWIRGEPIHDGPPAWFPAELCLRRPPKARTGSRPAESNGCAAGATLEAATAAAIAEAIERDAVALWWFGGAEATELAEGYLAEIGMAALLAAIRPETARRVWLLALPTEMRIPVVAALSSEPDGTAVVAGFAADPDPTRAATRAVLEMCQMELAQDLAAMRVGDRGPDGLSEQDRVWMERRRHLSVANYPRLRPAAGAGRPLRPATGTGQPLDILRDALAQAGFAAFRIDLTRPSLGIPVVRVLVPGLQSTRADWTTRRLRDAAHAKAIDLARRIREHSPI